MNKPEGDAQHSTATLLFFFGLLAGATLAMAYVLWDFLTDVVVGLLLAAAVRPVYAWILPRIGQRRWLSAGVTTVLVLICIAVPIGYFIMSLTEQATIAYRMVQSTIESPSGQEALQGKGWLGRHLTRAFALFGFEYSIDTLRRAGSKALTSAFGMLTGQANAIIANVVAVFYHLAMTLVVVYYGLIDGAALKQRLFDLSPLPENEEELIVSKFKDVGHAILIGSGAASLLQGALAGTAMWIAGLSAPGFWGAIVALFAFLPLIGTNVVVIPATIVLLFDGRWLAGLLFFAFTNLQGVYIDNIVRTKLMGSRMRIHTVLMLIALLGGISAFGFAGLLYGPLVVALFMTVLELYERVYRGRLFR